MAEAALLIVSSSLLSSNPSPKPSSPPAGPSPHRRHRRRLGLSAPKPLLSDVRQDLTAPPAHATSKDTRRLLKYYARLASKLALDGKLKDFLMIAESVLTSDAVAAESPQFVARIDTKMISSGIYGVLRNGRLGDVLDFLSGAERLGICPSSLFDVAAVEALGDQCRIIVKDGRLEEFVELMETLAAYRFSVRDVVDPSDILKVFVEKRDPNVAIRYDEFLSMSYKFAVHSQDHSRDVVPIELHIDFLLKLLLCSIMHEYGKKQDLESAMRTFEAMKQKSGGFNMFAYRSIIDICGLCGKFLRSRSIFEDLLAQRIIPNTYVFNSIMNVNAHDLSYTLHVYKCMQNSGVSLDVTSYNVLLKACSIAKRVDLAQDIYMQIKQMALRGVLRLDVITYSTMIKVFADAKMWQIALSVKEEMILADVRLNVVTWSSLIRAFASAGLVDGAVQLFKEMLMAGCEPNAQCCNVVLHACVEACQYDRAFRFFYMWRENGFKIFRNFNDKGCWHTNACLITKCTSEDDSRLSGQPKYTDDPQTPGNVVLVPFRPTVATFNILMKACGTDSFRAKALMDEMKIMGLSPNHISWSVLMDIYGTSQNMRGALQVFQTMRDMGIKPDVVAYTTAIKACVENKNLKIAFSLFEDMKRFSLQPNQVTYNTLLQARSKYGSLHEVQQCLGIYQDMRRAGYSANDYYLKELLEEWCEGVLLTHPKRGLVNIANSSDRTNNDRTCSLLFEKVAAHLQNGVGKNHAVDTRGLTKVEARIVVLSVLRMIKERYRLGKPITYDMIIITGSDQEHKSSESSEVQHAIIKVLRDELGLEVRTGHGAAAIRHDDALTPPSDVPLLAKSEPLQKDLKYLARRPQDFGLLKVTRMSLYHWLQKKPEESALKRIT